MLGMKRQAVFCVVCGQPLDFAKPASINDAPEVDPHHRRCVKDYQGGVRWLRFRNEYLRSPDEVTN